MLAVDGFLTMLTRQFLPTFSCSTHLSEMTMDAKTVEKLEAKIEDAIAEVIVMMGQKRLPLKPSHRTLHLMAKAAVAVYEATAENRLPKD